jgi:hypothetical protein
MILNHERHDTRLKTRCSPGRQPERRQLLTLRNLDERSDENEEVV